MKPAVIALSLLASISALAGFEPFDGAQISVTEGAEPSMSIHFSGEHAERMFGVLDGVDLSKKEIGTQGTRVVSQNKDVVCASSQGPNSNRVYSCALLPALQGEQPPVRPLAKLEPLKDAQVWILFEAKTPNYSASGSVRVLFSGEPAERVFKALEKAEGVLVRTESWGVQRSYSNRYASHSVVCAASKNADDRTTYGCSLYHGIF